MFRQKDTETVRFARIESSEISTPSGQERIPPKSPLGFLAQLEGRAPSEKRLPSAARQIKVWTLLAVLLIVAAFAQLLRSLPAPCLVLSRDSQYTFEGGPPHLPWPSEGQAAVEVEGVGVIGTRGETKSAPVASVAKTMTAFVILRDHPLDEAEEGPMIEVDQQAEEESHAESESTAAIRKGQKFSEKQLLQLLMIPSANNAARLLARWDSLSEEAFIKKMNHAARALGMNNTTYTDPSGLRATTKSTAADQLKLAKVALQNQVLREIVDTPQTEISGVPGTIYNNNGRALLYPGVNGIKTGSSTPAGGNLLWSADTVIDGKKRRIIGAVFGIRTGTTVNGQLQKAITKSIALIRATQETLISSTVVKKGSVVGYVDDGLDGRTPVVATEDLKAVGWPGLKVDIHLEGVGIPYAAPSGRVVGKVRVGTGSGMTSAPVALRGDLSVPDLGARLTRLG
ncbi:serine hydrolase [Streptomyces sp900105245]|uniref:Serine hydrolase n=1 Tax=Streptomyces sp. 900105245 TaxID=3154379 RepID=A0ABV1UMN1_9ACTN